MEKANQIAPLLLLVIAATWVPTRLARKEVSKPAAAPASDYYSYGPAGVAAPDYYSYGPADVDAPHDSSNRPGSADADDYNSYGPIPDYNIGLGPISEDDLAPLEGPYDEIVRQERAFFECLAHLEEKCVDQLVTSYKGKKLVLTQSCCLLIRGVSKRPCWDDILSILGIENYRDEIEGHCGGDLSTSVGFETPH